jgi:hypothetical protein
VSQTISRDAYRGLRDLRLPLSLDAVSVDSVVRWRPAFSQGVSLEIVASNTTTTAPKQVSRNSRRAKSKESCFITLHRTLPTASESEPAAAHDSPAQSNPFKS